MSDLIKNISELIADSIRLLDSSKLHSSMPKIEECLRDAKNKINEALSKIEDSKCDNHCFCRNDVLNVLHCCKCNESIKYEYKQYEWKWKTTSVNKWRLASTSRGTNPCENCQMNPAVNKFASGICHCALPAINGWSI